MNNMQWAIENRPQLFSGFDCAECDNRTNPAGCDMPDDELDETVCAKGYVAWLMKPHESGLEAAQTGDGEKDECEPAETENAPESDADSREKLEADVCWMMGHYFAWDKTRQEFVGHVLEWLDRQAAITKRECKRPSWEYCETCETVTECDRLKKRIAELEKRVWIAEETVSARELELKEECDYWKGQFRACLGAAAKDGYASGLLEYPKPNNVIEPFLVVTNCLDELRDQLADLKQSHAENLPETPDFAENPQKTPEQAQNIVAKDGKPIRIGETLTGEDGIAWTVKGFDRESKYLVIGTSCLETRHLKPEWLTHKFTEQHICDTCRFYTHVSDGTGDCHRWPREFVKDPDDWCGEWSK